MHLHLHLHLPLALRWGLNAPPRAMTWMLTPKTDSELISRFLAGDQRAFADLVRRYQSPIRQFLRRLAAGDHALADDMAQETFLKMFTSLASFRGDAGLSTWLHTIAYRSFLRHVASHSRLEFVLSDVAASVSAGGLVAALLVAALVVGTGKTIDSM